VSLPLLRSHGHHAQQYLPISADHPPYIQIFDKRDKNELNGIFYDFF